MIEAISILILLFITFPIFLTKNKRHNWLGWGYPEAEIGFDGCSSTSNCRFCRRRLLQDSNGDWFHIGATL